MGSIFYPRGSSLSHIGRRHACVTLGADQSGQVLAELAIISPIVMLVIMATFALGQAAQKQALVTRAASAAARVAVVRPDLARGRALEVLNTADASIRPADVRTTIEPVRIPALPFSKPARVTVTYKYRPISGFGWRPVFNLRAEFFSP